MECNIKDELAGHSYSALGGLVSQYYLQNRIPLTLLRNAGYNWSVRNI